MRPDHTRDRRQTAEKASAYRFDAEPRVVDARSEMIKRVRVVVRYAWRLSANEMMGVLSEKRSGRQRCDPKGGPARSGTDDDADVEIGVVGVESVSSRSKEPKFVSRSCEGHGDGVGVSAAQEGGHPTTETGRGRLGRTILCLDAGLESVHDPPLCLLDGPGRLAVL